MGFLGPLKVEATEDVLIGADPSHLWPPLATFSHLVLKLSLFAIVAKV